jgi:hypothetical protein
VTREEPRRWDWWLAGCGALAAVLIVVNVAAVVSDDVAAAPGSARQAHADARPSAAEGSLRLPSSWLPVSFANCASTGVCEDSVGPELPSAAPLAAAEPAPPSSHVAIRYEFR